MSEAVTEPYLQSILEAYNAAPYASQWLDTVYGPLWKTGDAARFVDEFLTPDAVMTASDGPAVWAGRESCIGAIRELMKGTQTVRARAVHLDPADKSDPVGGTGASDRISVSSKTIPELDVSYFFTKNIAAELVLTYPQKHDVSLDGAKIGTVKHLPPTLLVQYHFLPDASFRPYVGAGVNYKFGG